MSRKTQNTRTFIIGYYLFLEANSFPNALLFDRPGECSPEKDCCR